MLSLLLAIVLVLASSAPRAVAATEPASRRPGATLAASLGLSCDASRDGGPVLRRALAPGGEAAGGSLVLPSGCKVLLGSPGPGAAAVTLASHTTVRCEDGTAGFVLARRACAGGDVAGAACAADDDCRGGRCTADGDAGGAFAPGPDSTYTVLAAAPGASGVGLVGCGIWTQQQSLDSPLFGGSGNAIGYCVGGTNDGRSCSQVCSHDPDVGCDGDQICGFLQPGATCLRVDHCSAARPEAGRCVAIPSEIHVSPAGPGKIHPIDFAEARGARIDGLRIYDHRRGDFSVRTGLAASLVGSGNVDTVGSGVPTIYVPNQETDSQAYVGTGAIVQLGGHAAANQFFGWDAAFRLEGAVKAHDNQAGGLGRETFASWKGTVGFLLYWASNELRGNSLIADGTVVRRYSTPFICIAPYVGKESTGSGFNFLALGNLCEGTRGPKIVVNGAGNQYVANRLAWGSLGTVVAIGDVRGRCAGGPRRGLLCLDGAPSESALACPESACTFHADFRGGGGGHFLIDDNLIHADRAGRPARWIALAPWKRCLSGHDRGKGCASRSDCAGEAACTWPTLAHFAIEDNLLYGGGKGDVGIDLSAITGVLPDGEPPLQSGAISGNLFQGQEFGIKLPPDPAAARRLGISGTMAGVRVPLTDWDWSMGDLAGLAGLTRSDDQGQVVTLGAAEPLTRGTLVAASREIANAVARTDARSAGGALGVVLNSPAAGDDAKVMLAGTASCIADGQIALGALIAPSDSVPGSVRQSAADERAAVGSALEPAAAGSRFRCLIGRPAGARQGTRR